MNIIKSASESVMPFVLIFGMSVLISVAIIDRGSEYDVAFFMRDPNQLGGIPYFAGFVSSLGIMAWTGAAVVAIFAATTLAHMDGRRGSVNFLFWTGFITLLLGIDDLFLVHERISSAFSEAYVVAFYGLSLLTIFAMHLDILRRVSLAPLFVSASFFSISILVDGLQEIVETQIGQFSLLFEDGAKFIGILFWLVFLWRSSLMLCMEGSAGVPSRRQTLG